MRAYTDKYVHGKVQHDYEWLHDQDVAISCTDLDNRVTGPLFKKSKENCYKSQSG